MAREPQDIIKEIVAQLVFDKAILTSQLEAAQEEIAQLKASTFSAQEEIFKIKKELELAEAVNHLAVIPVNDANDSSNIRG